MWIPAAMWYAVYLLFWFEYIENGFMCLGWLDLASASIANPDVVESPVITAAIMAPTGRVIGHDSVGERVLLDTTRKRSQELLYEATRLVQHVRPARMLVDALIQVAVAVEFDDMAVHVGTTARLDHFY